MSANTAQLQVVERCSITREGRSYLVRYLVRTSDADDQSLVAMTASGIPMRGNYFVAGDSSDTAAYVSSYDVSLVEEEGSDKVWHVRVGFETRSNVVDPTRPERPGGYDYPWDEPTQVRGYARTTEERVYQHYSNPETGAEVPLQNTAGASYDDEYREVSHAILRLTKKYHYTTWHPSTVKPYINTLATHSFFSEAAGYYRMLAPTWTLQYTGDGVPFYTVDYEFLGKEGGWNGTDRVDEGYWYIDHDDDDKKKRFTDDVLLPTSGKGLLDGTGDKLETYEAPRMLVGGVNRYLEKSWTSLPIPLTISQVLRGQ